MLNSPQHAAAAFLKRIAVIAIALSGLSCSFAPPAEQPAFIRADAHSGGSVLAFSHSGDLLASGGWEGSVRLWQLPGGQPFRRWRDHGDSVNGIAFTADDTQVVSAGYDGRLVRRAVDGDLLQQVTTPAPITAMAAQVQADRLLTGHSDGVVRLWRLGDFKLLRERPLHHGTVKAVAIEAGARRYASSGADGRVFVWVAGGEATALEAPPTDSWALAFDPDGRWLTGGGWFRLFRWRLPEGDLTTLPTQHHGIIKAAEYVSGDVLATISRQTDSSVYFLDPATGNTLRRFRQHDLCGADVAISPHGRYLATTSDDASVRVWVLQPDE